MTDRDDEWLRESMEAMLGLLGEIALEKGGMKNKYKREAIVQGILHFDEKPKTSECRVSDGKEGLEFIVLFNNKKALTAPLKDSKAYCQNPEGNNYSSITFVSEAGVVSLEIDPSGKKGYYFRALIVGK
jgi:hypothetical protein